MPALSTLTAFPNYATLSSGDTITHTDHNTVRTSSKTYLDDYLSVMRDLEKNFASASVPTDKPQGKIWADTTTAARAILKFYYNGSSNLDSLCSLAAIETLTGAKTFSGGVTISTLLYLGGTTIPAGSPAKLLILETGAVLGTAATGFTMIGHVATDILDVTVGATATGNVRVNNTTTSTSTITGAIVNAGGMGVAGPLWVGGLANIAGALTVGGTVTIQNTNAVLEFWDTDAGDDLKRIALSNNAGVFAIQAQSDAGGGGGDLLSITRTANQLTAFNLNSGGVPSFSVLFGTGNVLLGINTSAPASLVAGLVIGASTAPSASPADGFALTAIDENGAGTRWPQVRTEAGSIGFPVLNTTAGLLVKVINIGNWNMDTTQTHTVAHGLTLAKIREVSATIQSDDGLQFFQVTPSIANASPVYASISGTDGTNVSLSRLTGGTFDGAGYTTPPGANRGWIVIWYIP